MNKDHLKSIFKQSIRYCISIIAVLPNVMASDLYIELSKKRELEERAYPTLSLEEKHKCIVGVHKLAKKISFVTKNKDSKKTSFLFNDDSISFPTDDGSIIIVKKSVPFTAKKFTPPKKAGIYEFNYYNDKFRFTVTPKNECASTKAIPECATDLYPLEKTVIDGDKVSNEEVSKYLFNSIIELNESISDLKNEAPTFSYISGELKVCTNALTDKKDSNQKFTETLNNLAPRGFYVGGGVGGSSGGGGSNPTKPSRVISSEKDSISQ